jgi:hypothetical protein
LNFRLAQKCIKFQRLCCHFLGNWNLKISMALVDG